MISQAAFDSLRMGATLALTLPTLGVRVSSPMRPLLDVSWMPRGLPVGVRHVAPCMFRRCVACAHHRRAAGEDVSVQGLPADVDPVVEILVGPGDRRLPSGIYQVKVDGGWRVVFPSLLPAGRCSQVLAWEWPELSFQADPLLGVTLVSWRRTEDEGPVAGGEAERVVDAQARLLVVELLEGLTPATRS